jgi:hypothetical protein
MRRFCEHMAAMHMQRLARGFLARKQVPNLRRLRQAPLVKVVPVAPIRPLFGAGVGLLERYSALPDEEEVEGDGGRGQAPPPPAPEDDMLSPMLAQLAKPPTITR